MKRHLSSALAFGAILSSAPTAHAHNDIEIVAAAGYRFPFGVDVGLEDPNGGALEEGRLSFNGAMVFSGMAAYRLRRDGFIYVSYTRGLHDVSFSGEREGVGFDFTGTRSIEYFQFGGNVEATRGRIVPYMGVSVGVGRVAEVGGGGSRLFFSPVLDPGVKYDVHDHIHLRLMGRVPLMLANKDLVCVQEGCAHASQISPIAQLEILGGVGVSF